MDNTVTLVGNSTRDVELKYLPSGIAVADVGLAVNRKWTDKATNEEKEEVSFFNVVAWGGLGEHVAESIEKGARIIVTGRLRQRSWETDAGEKRSSIEVVADEVAPSLRWATAVVTKVAGNGGGGGNRAPEYTDEDKPF